MSSYEPKPGTYDERLLAEAPQATRAAKQEGYNVDLLNQPHPAGGSSNSLQDPVPAQAVTPNRNAYTPPTPADADAVPQLYPSRKTPWYRTTRGIIILAVVALVIIGAVVGGAVGGTVGKSKSNNSAVPNPSSSSSATASAPSSNPSDNGLGQGAGSTPAATVAQQAGSTSASASSSTASGTDALETGGPQRRRNRRRI
ncbi:unnamed protein product [Peniophora sp. CBMAI 1063]|nr:unnamed protein product [Peniophora sp. CBMAI 1063]